MLYYRKWWFHFLSWIIFVQVRTVLLFIQLPVFGRFNFYRCFERRWATERTGYFSNFSSLFTTSIVVLPDQDFWCKFSSIECIWSLPWFANETVTTTVMTNVLTEESYNPSAIKTTNTQLKTVRTQANLISPLLFGFWKQFLDFYHKNFGLSRKLSIFASKQYHFLRKWVHCAIRNQRGKSSGRKQNTPNKLRKLNAELAKKSKTMGWMLGAKAKRTFHRKL